MNTRPPSESTPPLEQALPPSRSFSSSSSHGAVSLPSEHSGAGSMPSLPSPSTATPSPNSSSQPGSLPHLSPEDIQSLTISSPPRPLATAQDPSYTTTAPAGPGGVASPPERGLTSAVPPQVSMAPQTQNPPPAPHPQNSPLVPQPHHVHPPPYPPSASGDILPMASPQLPPASHHTTAATLHHQTYDGSPAPSPVSVQYTPTQGGQSSDGSLYLHRPQYPPPATAQYPHTAMSSSQIPPPSSHHHHYQQPTHAGSQQQRYVKAGPPTFQNPTHISPLSFSSSSSSSAGQVTTSVPPRHQPSSTSHYPPTRHHSYTADPRGILPGNQSHTLPRPSLSAPAVTNPASQSFPMPPRQPLPYQQPSYATDPQAFAQGCGSYPPQAHEGFRGANFAPPGAGVQTTGYVTHHNNRPSTLQQNSAPPPSGGVGSFGTCGPMAGSAPSRYHMTGQVGGVTNPQHYTTGYGSTGTSVGVAGSGYGGTGSSVGVAHPHHGQLPPYTIPG